VDRLSALDTAVAAFGQRLLAIEPEQWSKGTTCEEWTVRELVDHVLRTNIAYALLLDGVAWADVKAKLPINALGLDPLVRYREGAAHLMAAFRRPPAVEVVYDHPVRSMSRSDILDYRIFDVAVHAWDLARSIGVDDQLDDDLVAIALAGLQPIAKRLHHSGALGQSPSGGLPDGASAQTQLLDLSGRKPSQMIRIPDRVRGARFTATAE
jgi:uncharacterized protein (TIGR03086 family)